MLAKVEAGKTTTVQIPYSKLPNSYEAETSEVTIHLTENDVLGGNLERILLRKGLNIHPGNILLFEGTPFLFPEGFLRKVTDVIDIGEVIAVSTEQAKLDEAFVKLYIKAEKPVSPFEIAAALAEYKDKRFDISRVLSAFAVEGASSQEAARKLPIITPDTLVNALGVAPQKIWDVSKEWKFSLQGCASKPLSTIALKGCLGASASLGAELLIDVRWGRLNELKFTKQVSLEGTASLKLSPNDGTGGSEDRQKIAEVPLGQWAIGPVVLSPTAYAVVSFGAANVRFQDDGSTKVKIDIISLSIKKLGKWASITKELQGCRRSKIPPLLPQR